MTALELNARLDDVIVTLMEVKGESECIAEDAIYDLKCIQSDLASQMKAEIEGREHN